MVLWQSSQRPMYVRTVWVGGFRHAILTHDDPYLLRLHSKRRRPNSSASCSTNTNKSSRLSQHSDDLQDCVRKLNQVLTSDKSRINQRPATSGTIEHLNLHDVDRDFGDELIVKATPQPLNETNRSNYDSLNINMRNLRANKTSRTDAKENTELSERVLQWLDLAGKIDLLAPENVERMSQPRHSWPELQRRSHNLSKSKTTIDIHKEAGRTSPKGGDSPKAQQNGPIDRHEFYVPTSANTIENYARQSRNAKSTPRHETSAKIKDNHNKTKSRDLRTNVSETRLKVISEKNAVEKQYAEMLNKKLIPDVSKNPKRQVHIFMPDLPKKLDSTPSTIELRCDVSPAPFMLRPYAGLYNPFSHACSVLCNHPADTESRDVVKRAKDNWIEGKGHYFQEDLSKFQDGGGDKDKNRTPHDIFTEDMFRRYAETDSRPHTPAPTLASGKSRGSRRCLTPDQPHQRTTIVLDLRRSHSQETIYYHGYATSDVTAGQNTSPTNDRSTLPSLNLSDGAHNRLLKGQSEQLPPLASPLVLSKRSIPIKEPQSVRNAKKNQLKALNLGKPAKSKNNNGKEPPASQRSKAEKEAANEANDAASNGEDGGSGEGRRRGKRRKKGGRVGSDRLTSAGLAAQAQQDPETQIAGIGTDSQNPSSRGSIAPAEDDVIVLPVIRPLVVPKKTDSFLDDEMLKYLHREVDEDAIETEFDTKRRYVLEEAMRTRPERAYGQEMQKLLRELKVPAVSLGDWLHIPRVFSRQNAQFALPIDTNALEDLTPMNYAARFVTVKKSKQLLYLTVLRKFRTHGYRMPIKNIEEGLTMMMGGGLSTTQAQSFKSIMEWHNYEEQENIPDEIKVTLIDNGYKRPPVSTDNGNEESDEDTLKFRTWCGLCAICERMYGRFPPRDQDSPDGIELSDFSMVESKIVTLKIHSGLRVILNVIRER